MYSDILQQLGLSPNEAKIYEALLKYGASGASTISLRAKINRRNVYDTIGRLLEKGLVYEMHADKETRYQPVNPSKLLELAQERTHQIEKVLPALLSVFSSKQEAEQTYIYKGIEGIKNFMKDMLTVGEDIYVIGAKAAWFDPRMRGYAEWFSDELKRRGIKNNILFDHEVQTIIDNAEVFGTRRYKFLPKQYSTGSAIEIFGDRIVIYSGMELGKFGKYEDNISAFILVSPVIADTFRTWWKMLWDTLPEPPKKKK